MTSRDVAERAGVSRTTVSFVLNQVEGVQISEETRQRVLRAAQELNYYPDATARSLASRKTRIIGLVLVRSQDRVLADAFLPRVIQGLGSVMRERGFHILLQPVEDVDQPHVYIDLMHTKRVDGLILSGPRSDDEQLRQLIQSGFPLVLLGQLPNATAHFVDVDNVEAARKAVEHLIGLGHRRIGFIGNAPPQYTACYDRWQGYKLAMEAAGLEYNEALVRYGDFSEESGFEAMSDLLTVSPLPSAVFVASDAVAVGAMSAIKRQGLTIPQDIAVVGFDDVPLACYVDPPLTTMHLPARKLGQQAGEMLLELIETGQTKQEKLFLRTRLVIRDSCGARQGEQRVQTG